MKPQWWRSSIFGEIKRHCLAVISPESGLEELRDRRIFGAGTTAHDIHDAVQRATNDAGEELMLTKVEEIALAVIERGAEDGRRFEKHVEPPLRAEAYLEGKDLALAWLADHPALPGRESEIAITIDSWATLVPGDSDERWLRGIIDILYIDDDGVLVLPDLKTDWRSNADALWSPQRKCQVILGFARHGSEISGIRPEIWNLRHGVVYPRPDDREQYTLRAETMGVVDVWRQDFLALTRGYEARLEKDPSMEGLASPGPGCLAGETGCPCLSQCSPGMRWVAARGHEGPAEMARQAPVLQAELKRIRSLLEPAALELGVLSLGDMEVGFEEKQTADPVNAAILELWREFRGELDPSDSPEIALHRERDLLETFLGAIRTSKDGFEKIEKKLWPLNRGTKEEKAHKRQTRGFLEDRLLQPRKYPQWFCRKAELSPEEKKQKEDEKQLAAFKKSIAKQQKADEEMVSAFEESITQAKERNRFEEKGDAKQ